MNSAQRLANHAAAVARRTERKAQQQAASTTKRSKIKKLPMRQSNDNALVYMLILALGYLLTSKWFWVALLTLSVLGFFIS